MIDISGQNKCFHCDEDIQWGVFYKEAEVPYTEGRGMVRVHHSGHSEINRLQNVKGYAFIDNNLLSIDTVCPHCGMINRITYQIDTP